jgi:hypothetical protein
MFNVYQIISRHKKKSEPDRNYVKFQNCLFDLKIKNKNKNKNFSVSSQFINIEH